MMNSQLYYASLMHGGNPYQAMMQGGTGYNNFLYSGLRGGATNSSQYLYSAQGGEMHGGLFGFNFGASSVLNKALNKLGLSEAESWVQPLKDLFKELPNPTQKISMEKLKSIASLEKIQRLVYRILMSIGEPQNAKSGNFSVSFETFKTTNPANFMLAIMINFFKRIINAPRNMISGGMEGGIEPATAFIIGLIVICIFLALLIFGVLGTIAGTIGFILLLWFAPELIVSMKLGIIKDDAVKDAAKEIFKADYMAEKKGPFEKAAQYGLEAMGKAFDPIGQVLSAIAGNLTPNISGPKISGLDIDLSKIPPLKWMKKGSTPAAPSEFDDKIAELNKMIATFESDIEKLDYKLEEARAMRNSSTKKSEGLKLYNDLIIQKNVLKRQLKLAIKNREDLKHKKNEEAKKAADATKSKKQKKSKKAAGGGLFGGALTLGDQIAAHAYLAPTIIRMSPEQLSVYIPDTPRNKLEEELMMIETILSYTFMGSLYLQTDGYIIPSGWYIRRRTNQLMNV